MVRLEDVFKRYDGHAAVIGVSVSVEQGETVAFVGPSGAGKTTLLRLIAGTLAPEEGRVLLSERDIAGMKPGRDLARLVGIVAQQYDLVPNLSALHNVLAGRLGEWSFWRSLASLVIPQDKRMGMDALERVGILDRAGIRAGRLSGGEQQRAAIARVLVQDPGLILADEPVSSLDPARAGDILRLLIGVTRDRGKTLVASMHAVDLARTHFDRLIGLRHGEVQFDLPSTDVTDSMLSDLYSIEHLQREGPEGEGWQIGASPLAGEG